jgi:hypothetical protein
MVRKYENSKWFKWSMNALLLISFPAFLWFIKWAINDTEVQVLKTLGLFTITTAPLVYSLFYNMKFLAPLVKSYDPKQSVLWALMAFFIIYLIVFYFMLVFTYYIDNWYLIMVPITSILGIIAMVKYIKSGKK